MHDESKHETKHVFDHPTLPGETEALATIDHLAKVYGYGNIIAWLKRQWAMDIVANYPGISYEQAVEATNISAYPKEG